MLNMENRRIAEATKLKVDDSSENSTILHMPESGRTNSNNKTDNASSNARGTSSSFGSSRFGMEYKNSF